MPKPTDTVTPTPPRGLTADQVGSLHDDLRSLLEVETRRVAALEADGLPPIAARDLLELAEAISAALERIDAGRYGTCERCGRTIPFDRLEAVPYAQRCVPCEALGASLLG